MEQDNNTGITDMQTEVAGAASDVSVQRDLQANEDNASAGDFEQNLGGTAAVSTGNFPGPTFVITPDQTADNQEAAE